MSVNSPSDPQLAAKRSVYLSWLSRWLTKRVIILHASSSKVVEKVWMLALTLASPLARGFLVAVAGCAPFLLCSCSCLVLRRLPQEWSYLSFHLFTCTMGFAPIKWTCTAFFRPRQLTDRAILANRQPQEKTLGQNGIQVTYIEGAIHWFGGKKHG